MSKTGVDKSSVGRVEQQSSERGGKPARLRIEEVAEGKDGRKRGGRGRWKEGQAREKEGGRDGATEKKEP
jgi:hypothetical protein